MGQKVNPHGLRVGVIKGWDSRWFANKKDFADILIQDYNIRKFLKRKLYDAGIPRVEIERDATKIRVNIHCAKPGRVIGEGGKNVDLIKNDIEKFVNKGRTQKLIVFVNIIEVKQQDKNAQLVAENIAIQLEKRISFRRAMKQAIQKTMSLGTKGIKIAVSGRLAGAEIARTEHYHEGTIPLQTLRANIDYGFAEADTTYGKIGVKVWIYHGEVLHGKVDDSSNGYKNKKNIRQLDGKSDKKSDNNRKVDRRFYNKDKDRKPHVFGRRPNNNATAKKS